MKKFLFAMVAMMVLGLAASCGDTDTVVEGAMPVEIVGPVVNYDVPVCTSDADCGDDELCMLDSAATESVGHTIMVCVIGCDAELETVEVQNEDGTSSTVTTKVEGTDTCQRFGDTTLYCDLASHECKEYSAEEPVVEPEPVELEPVVEPTDVNTEVKCCYDPQDIEAGLYGVFAYSISSSENPAGWQQTPDLDIKADGCFSVKVDMDLVFEGFWVDMTRGLYPEDGTEIPDDFFVAEAAKPTACYIGGQSVLIGKFDAGWELGSAVGRQ